MKPITSLLAILFLFFQANTSHGQDKIKDTTQGTFSIGVRSTISNFSHDGTGIGTGGQFRIQLNKLVNTDWFADFISIQTDDQIRSDYYHIGWSVLFYPLENRNRSNFVQPYILAGHCFDYNRKTSIEQPKISKDRWGSAIQGGLGIHFNLNKKLDLSITTQYMTHLTKTIELDLEMEDPEHDIENEHRTLEGHLLSTLSLNYKIGKLWGR